MTLGRLRHLKRSGRKRHEKEFPIVTRIWRGATPAAKSDEYLKLMRTIALPDYRSTPANQGAYALAAWRAIPHIS
jgi:hypothetical protein